MSEKILKNWKPTDTRLKNIERNVRILDRDTQFYKGVPIPSWIELSVIDACNRTCSFCPKSDENIAPNSYQKMTVKLIDKLCDDLKKINYEGAFCLSGYGEPTLHNNLHEMIFKLSLLGAVELISNGDTLSPKKIKEFYDSNLSKLIISMYDGEHQIEKFKKMREEAKVPEDFLVLRNTWYDKEDNFGLLLTNRAGTNTAGNQPKVNLKRMFLSSLHISSRVERRHFYAVMIGKEEFQWGMSCKLTSLKFGTVKLIQNTEKLGFFKKIQ